MASKVLIVLGVLATAFAAPSGYGHKHSGSHCTVRPTGSVRSHHHHSGTRASSKVRTHSAAESITTSLAAEVSSVPYQYNQISQVGGDGCLTVTTRVQVTVTVTGDAAASTTVSSADVHGKIISTAAKKDESHTHHHQHSHSTTAQVSIAVVQSSSEVAAVIPTTTAAAVMTPATTLPQTTTTAAAIVPVISIPAIVPAISIPAISINILPSPVATTTAAPAAATSPYTSSSNGNKRGLAYNDASLVQSYANTNKIGWAYNWGSSTTSLPSGIKYVPTLWGTRSDFTGGWVKNAQSAISNGATHLFSFNEPDMTSQSDMSPAVAAAAYKLWMHDKFANTNTKLCAPSVTNGSPDKGYGLGWLSSFMEQCKGCQIDCINIHWYGDDVSDLKTHVSQAISQAAAAGIHDVWLTEFGLNGSPSADTSSAFLSAALPWLDAQNSLTGYSYFMLSQGRLVNGNSLNAAGQTYMTSS